MCEVVDLSDDDECLKVENGGNKLKEESLDYNLPFQNMFSGHEMNHAASSSQSSVRSAFLDMGFSPFLVDKAIDEKGEENTELLLETLLSYSRCHKSEPVDSLFDEETIKNPTLDRGFLLKEEPGVCSGIRDDKMTSLLKLNFSSAEASFAIDKLGKEASIDQLKDFIFADRVVKKYEKIVKIEAIEGESNEDDNHEALFDIMGKTLRLLAIGFSEQEISEAFEKCGYNASLEVLTDSMFPVELDECCSNSDMYSSAVSTSRAQINNKSSLKRTGENSYNRYLDSSTVKQECQSDAAQDRISDLLEMLKGKRQKVVQIEKPSNSKKLKEEIDNDMRNSSCVAWLEARRRNSTSANEKFDFTGSLEEDQKPELPESSSCRNLTKVAAKPPYFFFGNVTYLSRESWAKISQFLYSVQPEFVDSGKFSALERREGYVHNLPIENRAHLLPQAPMTIEASLRHTRKWWPIWDSRKLFSNFNCKSSSVSMVCRRLRRTLAESRGNLTSEQQREILHQCQSMNLVWIGHQKLGPLEPEHVESIMGYPLNHSRIAGFDSPERLQSLEVSFQTDTLAFHLSVMKPLFPNGISVLSFFTGLGGDLITLHRLGIRLTGVVSIEPCERKRKVVEQWWVNSWQNGELIQVESSHKLTSNKLQELLKKFGGFDFVICQNPYSSASCDDLAGLDFSLFLEFFRVLQSVRMMMERSR